MYIVFWLHLLTKNLYHITKNTKKTRVLCTYESSCKPDALTGIMNVIIIVFSECAQCTLNKRRETSNSELKNKSLLLLQKFCCPTLLLLLLSLSLLLCFEFWRISYIATVCVKQMCVCCSKYTNIITWTCFKDTNLHKMCRHVYNLPPSYVKCLYPMVHFHYRLKHKENCTAAILTVIFL